MKLTDRHKRQIKMYFIIQLGIYIVPIVKRCVRWREPINITPECIVIYTTIFIVLSIIINYREWPEFKLYE
jgi:hypothetical protein